MQTYLIATLIEYDVSNEKKNQVLCVCSGLTELEQAERPTHYRACNENIMT